MHYNPCYPHPLVSKSDDFFQVAEDYISHPEKYTRTFSVVINGKLRRLITYQPNEYGYKLRELHEAIVVYLRSKYKQASGSYAYAKKKGILDCLTVHLRASVFLKTDIHSFFDSISYEKMISRINCMKISRKVKKKLPTVLKACFYNESLPIGFVSSPILSDIFLVDVDTAFENIKGVNYTRYADDFIISVDDEKNTDLLTSVKCDLEKELSCLSLELNKKKTYFRYLKLCGDAIHVLGVNLVKDYSENRITVSDKYIRETCVLIAEYINELSENREELLLKIVGRIEFIRHCSKSSYEKLCKMTKIKCGSHIDLSAKSLRSL